MNDSPHKSWDNFIGMIVRYRYWAMIVAVGITVLSGAYMPTMKFSTDPTAYLPQDREEVRFWTEMSNRFGALDLLLIGLEEPAEGLTTDGLARVARITDIICEMKTDGVLSARSLTNVEAAEVDEDGTLQVDNMVPSIPRTDEGRKALADKILGDLQVPGALISRDLKGYLVLVRTNRNMDQGRLAGLIADRVEAERGPMNAYYFGASFVGHQIGRQLFDQLPWVVPAFAIGLFAVLLIWLRRPKAIFLTLITAGLPLLWWMGMLSLFGIEVSTAVLNGALLLLPVGAVTFARMAEARLVGRKGFFGLRSFLLLIAGAVAFGALAVFHDHAAEKLPYLAHFGEAMVVGFLALIVFAFTGAVPLLSFLPIGSAPEPVPQLSQNVRATISRRIVLVVTGIAIVVLGLFGALHLKFAVNLSEMFSKTERVGATLAFFDRHFGGSNFIQISVKGDFTKAENLQRLMRLGDLLEGSRKFPDVRLVTQVLGFVNKGMAGLYWIAPDSESVQNLWFFLADVPDVGAMITDDRDEAMVTVRVPFDGSMNELVATVQKAIDDSAVVGPESAKARLLAIGRVFDTNIDAKQLEAAVTAITGVENPQTRGNRRIKAITDVAEYMKSDAAPFVPTDEEWPVIAQALANEKRDKFTAQLTSAIKGLASYQTLGAPDEFATEIAMTLIQKFDNADLELQTKALVDIVFGPEEGSQVSDLARVRARGVLAALKAGEKPAGDLKFTISGFPALAPAVERQLISGLRMAVAIILGVFSLLAIISAFWRPSNLRAIPEAVAGTLATAAIGALLGIHVDSGSATMYLLAPTIAWFLSPPLAETDGRRGRFPVAFALAFAVAALALALTGVMPVVRLGVAMALGLATSAIATLLGK